MLAARAPAALCCRRNRSHPSRSLKRDGKIRGVNDVKGIEGPDHFQNRLQCIRSGKTTRAPIEAGYQHAVACIMAVESFNLDVRTVYDHEKQIIKKG